MEVAASFNANAILLSHAAGNVPITSLLIFRLNFRRPFYFHRARLYIVFFFLFSNNRTPHNFKYYAFTSGVFMKVDKILRKKRSSFAFKEHKHLAFVTRSTEKILRLITNLENVPQVPFPQKK